MQIIINILLSYLIGSISGSIVLGRLRGIDIRLMGSGNAGGTNALRTVGTLFALGVIFIDITKGIIAVTYISSFHFFDVPMSYDLVQVLCGIGAVIGHVFPIYHNFNGGKGAGTLIGIIGVLFPQSIIYVFLIWIITLILTGYVGLSSINGGITLIIITFLKYSSGLNSSFGYFSILMALFIIFTHRSNIKRMLNGSENRFEKIMLFKKYFTN